MLAQALATYLVGVLWFFFSSVQLRESATTPFDISRWSDWEVVLWVLGVTSSFLILLFAVIAPLLPGHLAIFGFP